MSVVGENEFWDLAPEQTLDKLPAINLRSFVGSSEIKMGCLSSLIKADPSGLRTYLILDPTLRKSVQGLFDLDSLAVPAQSLFDGAAEEKSQEVAPWLVDVTIEEGARPSHFASNFLDQHFGKSTGIIVRSMAPFQEVRKHFRKFTKLQVQPDMRWFFFRFWDPRIASIYFRTIQHNPDRVAQWFGRGLIDQYIVEEEHGKVATVFAYSRPDIASNLPLVPVVLTDWELDPFRQNAYQRDVKRMAENLKRDFPSELKAYPLETIVSLIRPVLKRFVDLGFRRIENLHVLAAWSLFFGANFVSKDPDGELERICKLGLPENERFRLLKARMASLRSRGEPT